MKRTNASRPRPQERPDVAAGTVQTEERKAKRRRVRKRDIYRGLVLAFACIGAVTVIVLLAYGIRLLADGKAGAGTSHMLIEERPSIDVELLTPNEYSRPQLALSEVKGIVIHYTANPGTTAFQNHDYFEGLKDTGETHASSHFIIGLDGEIVQCIPTSEEAYASNSRNSDTLSIECCHGDSTGKFNDKTYDSCVELTAWLCTRFGLDPETDVIRHYDITGKDCPKYYVEHEEAWTAFKSAVAAYIKSHGTKVSAEEYEQYVKSQEPGGSRQ